MKNKLPDRPDGEVEVLADLEIETNFLACMMLNTDIAPNYVALPAVAFYSDEHQKVWRAIQALHQEGKAPEMTRVSLMLRDMGMASVPSVRLVSGILDRSLIFKPHLEDADKYYEALNEVWRKRRMDEFIQKLKVSIRYPGTDWKVQAQKEFANIFTDGVEVENPFINLAEYELPEDEGKDCISTGLATLDYFLDGGLKLGELILLAARTSMGKTAFMCWLALAAAHVGKNVSVISVEMDMKSIYKRWLGAYGNFPYKSWRYATKEIKDAAVSAVKERGKRIEVNPVSRTPDQILASIRRDMMRRRVDIVFVDHLHHAIAGNGQDERSEAAKFVTQLKNLANETNTAVVLLAQLNRGVESRNDKRPSLSDIREFGSTEQIVDLAMMLYRDEYYHPDTVDRNVTEIIIPKNRNGQTCSGLKVLSDLATNRYYDFSTEGQAVLGGQAYSSQGTEGADF